MSAAFSVCKSAYFFLKSFSSAKKYADLRERKRETGRERGRMAERQTGRNRERERIDDGMETDGARASVEARQREKENSSQGKK